MDKATRLAKRKDRLSEIAWPGPYSRIKQTPENDVDWLVDCSKVAARNASRSFNQVNPQVARGGIAPVTKIAWYTNISALTFDCPGCLSNQPAASIEKHRKSPERK